MNRNIFLTMATALMSLGLTGCAQAEDATPDYRYRLTVEIDTPQGLRSGSSVIEVEQSMGSTAMSGFGRRLARRVRGEAVAVDLPDGRTLFALLRSDDNYDWASSIMQSLAPDIEGEPWESVSTMSCCSKARSLPRTLAARRAARGTLRLSDAGDVRRSRRSDQRAAGRYRRSGGDVR